MSHPRYTADEIVTQGQALYNAQIRSHVEQKDHGQALVIDIETGDYEISQDDVAASHRLLARHPGAALYAMRIGSATFGRIGRKSRGVTA